jgi:predicted DNA-binding transcriptional regulator AlpA
MPDAPNPPRRLIQFRPFCTALSISRATGWRWVKAGKLRKPLAIGGKYRGYEASYLDEVVAQLKAAAEPAE